MADMLNEYFVLVFIEETFEDFPISKGMYYSSDIILDYVEFTPATIAKKLKLLSFNKSPWLSQRS